MVVGVVHRWLLLGDEEPANLVSLSIHNFHVLLLPRPVMLVLDILHGQLVSELSIQLLQLLLLFPREGAPAGEQEIHRLQRPLRRLGVESPDQHRVDQIQTPKDPEGVVRDALEHDRVDEGGPGAADGEASDGKGVAFGTGGGRKDFCRVWDGVSALED
jgi:hypothetical protein